MIKVSESDKKLISKIKKLKFDQCINCLHIYSHIEQSPKIHDCPECECGPTWKCKKCECTDYQPYDMYGHLYIQRELEKLKRV